MASGRLGAADLAANNYTTVYTTPAGKVASATLSLCNRTASTVFVRVALAAAAGTPTDAEYIEYGAAIPANGVLERSGLVLSDTSRITVYPTASGVSAVVFGFEE